MKYCKRCHRIIPEGQKNCPYCERDAGRLGAPAAEQPKIERRRRTRTLQEAFEAPETLFAPKAEEVPAVQPVAEAAEEVAAPAFEAFVQPAAEETPAPKKNIFRAAPKAEEAPAAQVAEESPAPAEKAPAEETPAPEAIQEEVSLRMLGAPAEEAPAAEAPEEAPAEAPAEEAAEEAPAEEQPAKRRWFRAPKAEETPEAEEAAEAAAPALLFGENGPAPTEEAPVTDEDPFRFENTAPRKDKGAPGDLELELAEHHESPADRLIGKGAVHVLVAIACLAVLAAGFFIGRTAMNTKPQPTDSIVAEYLQGGWLSEEFTFVEDDSYIMREFLTVNEDLTFTLKCVVPEQSKPEGYLDGSWQAVYTLTGTVQLSLEDGSILLEAVDEEGNRYAYTRFITNAADGQLTLREYYDEAKTEYYDVLFEQVALPAETAPAA